MPTAYLVPGLSNARRRIETVTLEQDGQSRHEQVQAAFEVGRRISGGGRASLAARGRGRLTIGQQVRTDDIGAEHARDLACRRAAAPGRLKAGSRRRGQAWLVVRAASRE